MHEQVLQKQKWHFRLIMELFYLNSLEGLTSVNETE